MNTDNYIWDKILNIIDGNFSEDGLKQLEKYAEQFNERKILYQRFSPAEQYGCTTGGINHVIASLLAGAEVAASRYIEGSITHFKTEIELAKKQIETIRKWALKQAVWFDDIDRNLKITLGDHIAQGGEATVFDSGTNVIKTIGLDYFIQPIYALDRISLHNAWFPETSMKVIGFGENSTQDFCIIVEQPHIQGFPVTDQEISQFATSLGFKLKNPGNWTYSTPDIYLSDLHDENVLKSRSGIIFVIDCDIRINSPHLRADGQRTLTTDIQFAPDQTTA